jgi:hypothetical protein
MRFAIACLVLVAAAAAQAEDKMQQPKPDPMLTDAFSGALGSWKCTGTWKGPDGKEMKTSSTMKFEKELKGFVYEATSKYKGGKEMPAMEMHMHWGMAPTEHKIMQTGFDTMGGSWMAMSDGWQGDTMKSEGNASMMGKSTKTRSTITRADKGKTITIVDEMENAGSWMEMGREECKKG